MTACMWMLLLPWAARAESRVPTVQLGQVEYSYRSGVPCVSCVVTGSARSLERVRLDFEVSDAENRRGVGTLYLVGKQRARQERQNRLLGCADVSEDSLLTAGETRKFTFEFPMERWMKEGVRLSVSGVEDCCGKTTSLGCMGQDATVFMPVQPVVSMPKEVTRFRDYMQRRFPFAVRVGDAPATERGTSVRFPVSRTVLLPNFQDNRASLDTIMAAVQAIRDEPTATFSHFTIVGYASPEGNLQNNKELSNGRAFALRDYLMEQLDLTRDAFECRGLGSDWKGLRQLVVESGMDYADAVVQILDSVPEAQRNDALRRLRGGKVYQSMLDVLYPRLRDACYINVWYTEHADRVVTVIQLAREAMGRHAYGEALGILAPIEGDVRSLNPRAVCHYYLGKTEEAIRLWRLAAEQGDEDAKENLIQVTR